MRLIYTIDGREHQTAYDLHCPAGRSKADAMLASLIAARVLFSVDYCQP